MKHSFGKTGRAQAMVRVSSGVSFESEKLLPSVPDNGNGTKGKAIAERLTMEIPSESLQRSSWKLRHHRNRCIAARRETDVPSESLHRSACRQRHHRSRCIVVRADGGIAGVVAT